MKAGVGLAGLVLRFCMASPPVGRPVRRRRPNDSLCPMYTHAGEREREREGES